MSYFFTTFFKQQLFANQAIMGPTQPVRLCLFSSAPSLAGDNSKWLSARTKADLTALPGWVEVSGIAGYPLTLTVPVSTRSGVAGKTGNSFVLFSEYAFTGIDPVGIAAIGVEFVSPNLGGVANPLMFVTTTPIGSGVNIYPKDKLTAVPDASFPDSTNQYLFSWATPAGGATTLDPVEGPLAIVKGAPVFEPSNTLHVWLYPQRANMIANPSFEKDANYWAPVPTQVLHSTEEKSMLKSSYGGSFARTAYLGLPGTTGNYISTPDAAVFDITSDLELVVRAAASDWTAAGIQTLVSKWTDTGNQRSYMLRIGTNGRPELNLSTNGTVGVTAAATVTPPFVDGVTTWIKATWRRSDGRVQFFYAPDQVYEPTTWTQIGADVIQQAGLSTYIGTAAVMIGARNTAPDIELLAGRVSKVFIRSGIGGTTVASPDFTVSSSGTTTVIDAQNNTWTLQGTGAAIVSNPLAIESNIWDTRFGDTDSELWTLQLMAKGTGKLKVGLVYWDAAYRGTNADWGTETWETSELGWIHVACVRRGPGGHTAMMRIECLGNLTIDNVLAERGTLVDWPYFDGRSTYGAPNDYSWYGGTVREGATYSMWYSDRRAVMGRLFSSAVVTAEPGDVVTDEEVKAAGMVYQWVPAGVTVVPHLDVLYPNDLQPAPPLRSTSVLPYAYDGDGGGGIPWPWETGGPASIRSTWGSWNAQATAIQIRTGGITSSWGVWVSNVSATVQPAILRVGTWQTASTTNTGNPLVISRPVGSGVGDLLLLVVASDFAYGPTGWGGIPNLNYLVAQPGASGPKFTVLYAPITSGPPATYSLTFPSAMLTPTVVALGAYRYIQIGTVVSGTIVDTGAGSIGTSLTLGNQTPVHNGAMGIGIAASASLDMSVNNANGFTLRANVEQTNIELAVFDTLFGPAQLQGFPTIGTSNVYRRGVSLSLCPI